MLRFVLPLAIFCALSCSKEHPPTAPAGKKNCALCDFLGDDKYTISEGQGEHTAPDSSSPSDGVFIPDTALRTHIERELNKSPGETITQADMNALESLWGAGEIKNLKGLETAKNLQSLDLPFNQISDLTPLANLDMLQYLVLGYNQISDLTPLANLDILRTLHISSNQISDLTPLANLDMLQTLGFPDNQVSDLTPLTNLSNLRYIYFKQNNVSDLAPLTELPDLKSLDARVNPLSKTSINKHIPALQDRGVDVSISPFQLLPATESPFSIDLVFLGDLTELEQELWHRVAKRWEAAIRSELPDYEFSEAWFGECGGHSIEIPAGEQIDDLRIYVAMPDEIISGRQKVLGTGGARLLRSSSFPIIGCVEMLKNLHLPWAIGLHEVGHVLGIGTIWHSSGMLRDLNADAHFAGPKAIAAFNQADRTNYQGAKVPTEPDGVHWRTDILQDELMAHAASSDNLSAITLQALSDLGYSVDLSAADPHVLFPYITIPAAKPVADAEPFCSLEGLPAPVYVND